MKITHREKFPDHIGNEVLKQASENMMTIFRGVYTEMSDELSAYIKSKQIPVYYPAGEVVVDYGAKCDHVLFIYSGLISSSFIIEGEEKEPWYHTPGKVVIAVEGWYTQGPSDEKLTAIQETLCMAISWQDMEDILEHYVEFNVPIRRLTELYLRDALKRTLLIYYNAPGKYKFSIQNHWDIVKSIPFYKLAEVLGVARETISRIRNQKW